MSWLIDELSEENNRLHGEVFSLSRERNILIKECSQLITEVHKKNDDIERLNRIINRHYLQLGLKKDNTINIVEEIKQLYPKFIDKIKLFWSILK